MVKRVAGNQLTREFGEQEEEYEELEIAPTNVLNKRKILQPRGKQFAFKPSPFISKPSPNETHENSMLKALNNKFVASVLENTKGDTVADLRGIARKYIQFCDDLLKPTASRTALGDSHNSQNTIKEASGEHSKLGPLSANNSRAEPNNTEADISNQPTNIQSQLQKPDAQVTGNVHEQKQKDPESQIGNAEDDSGAHFEPVASLGDEKIEDPNIAEEERSTIFSCRSKVLLFQADNKENPYSSIGVGDLKILQPDGGKKRLLVRADGGLRVLINAYLIKDIKYDKIGNGSMIRMPTPNSDGTLLTYILKVKTPDLGEELLNVMNS